MADPTFAEWLRHQALAAGYDLDGTRGAQAALAKATGISSTQIGRTFNGTTTPDLRSQLHLARVLHVDISEMLIRSGFAEPSDFPDAPKPPRAPTVYEAAEAWGIDPSDAPILQALVEGLQKRRARLGKERTQLYSRVSDLATQLSWDDAHHSGDIPEVLSGLQRLAEDLQEPDDAAPPPNAV